MSSQTPTISKATISEILCAVLRGDSMEWPDFSEADFYDALLEQAIYHGVDSLLCDALRPSKAWEALPAQVF